MRGPTVQRAKLGLSGFVERDDLAINYGIVTRSVGQYCTTLTVGPALAPVQ
jgi:hypothetical protein